MDSGLLGEQERTEPACYKQFQGDRSFPRTGFSQGLLTTCASSVGSLTLSHTWPWLGRSCGHLPTLRPHPLFPQPGALSSCLSGPLLYFWRIWAIKNQGWIPEWTFLTFKLEASCHGSVDAVDSESSAMWTFHFRLNTLVPLTVAFALPCLHSANSPSGLFLADYNKPFILQSQRNSRGICGFSGFSFLCCLPGHSAEDQTGCNWQGPVSHGVLFWWYMGSKSSDQTHLPCVKGSRC